MLHKGVEAHPNATPHQHVFPLLHQVCFRSFATHPCETLEVTPRHGARIGYARVSSTDQNLARQLATLGEVDKLFEEKQSGAKRTGRTALANLIGYVRDGDTVVVSSMDRLARSVVDLNPIPFS